jgi:GntR family transcriptional regulator
MQIRIDLDLPTPLFTQLQEQIKRVVTSGLLAPGDPLPSIRQLASDLELNSKTVAKAYRLLERDGIIQTKGYRGTFIHPDATQNAQVDIQSFIVAELEHALATLRRAGATDSEIRIAFNHVINQPLAKDA